MNLSSNSLNIFKIKLNSNISKSVPIGVILPQMGGNQPAGFLKCDGSTYSISAYQDLANYFYNQFGSVKYFGGNGTSTFAVPNLQGEFLRGAGTNSHTNQGAGGSVGEHQNATEHQRYTVYGGSLFMKTNSSKSNGFPINAEKLLNPNSYSTAFTSVSSSSETNDYINYTSRPTNTSVLYIIKAYYNLF